MKKKVTKHSVPVKGCSLKEKAINHKKDRSNQSPADAPHGQSGNKA
jgi:hypothetical protein